MKARIEKKLSKRLAQIAPSIFRGAWVDKDEPSVLAYEQGTRVSHILSVGGGVDYFGEGEDAYTVWDFWRMNWMWHGDFKPYPEGHHSEGYPNTERFRHTTINLLKLAADAEAGERTAKEARAAQKAYGQAAPAQFTAADVWLHDVMELAEVESGDTSDSGRSLAAGGE